MRQVLTAVTVALVAGHGWAGPPPAGEFKDWNPPKTDLNLTEAVAVQALCDGLTQAVRTADIEKAATLFDFPVSLVTDDGTAEATGATLDKAHWIGAVDSAIEEAARSDLALDAQCSVWFLSDALAQVTVRHVATRQQYQKKWTSILLVVKRKGAWLIKGMGGRGWGSLPTPPRGMTPRASLPPAQELFIKRCATCHGRDGRGQTVIGVELQVPDLTDPALHARLSDEQILKQILDGSVDADTGRQRMTAYREKYPEEELRALVPVVRALKKKPSSKR